MRLTTVSPAKTYSLVTPNGSLVKAFFPGDRMHVDGTRPTAFGEMLSVTCDGYAFEIPKDRTYVVDEESCLV